MATANRSASGSTRGWRKLRAQFDAQLPLPCAICHLPIGRGDAWHLHHTTAFVHGGSELTAWPAHALCNLRAGDRPVTPVYVDPTLVRS